MPEIVDVASDVLRVMVVDDHCVFAELLSGALSALPGIVCVGTASSAAAGIALAIEMRPDVVVMDIEMPTQDGLAATRRIREVAPDACIVIMSAHQEPEWAGRAARAGASAFVRKDSTLEELADVLRLARAEPMPAVRSTDPSTHETTTAFNAPTVGLTGQEHKVLVGLSRGLPLTVIAENLGIRRETCRTYVKSVRMKLGARTQLEAVITAQQLGLIHPSDE